MMISWLGPRVLLLVALALLLLSSLQIWKDDGLLVGFQFSTIIVENTASDQQQQRIHLIEESSQAQTTTDNTTTAGQESQSLPQLKVVRRRRNDGRTELLEFVHIPKTGGTAIEVAAALRNVTWGMCHFRTIPEQFVDVDVARGRHGQHYVAVDFTGCNHFPPNFTLRKPFCPYSCWHLPPADYIRNDATTTNNNNNNTQGGGNDDNDNPYIHKNLFTIVRNPYSKMISEYYCPWAGYKGRDRNSPTTLNQFLQQSLRKYQGGRWNYGGHWTPQSDFVFGQLNETTGRIVQVVDHVLFFEDMDAQIQELFQSYNLGNITLLSTNIINPGTVSKSKQLGIGDLSNETIHLINTIYDDDFRSLGYSQIDPNNKGWEQTYRFESIYMT